MADRFQYIRDIFGNRTKIRLTDMGDGTYAQRVDVALNVADEVTVDQGDAITGESLEAGGAATLGWLSSIRKKLETGLAKDGTDITTPTAMPTGGVGLRGWLSAIWTKLNGSLAVTGTFFQSTQPTSDVGPGWTSSRGIAGLPFSSAAQNAAPASITDAPAAGQKLCITDLIISTDTDMTVTFKEETSGTVVGGPYYVSGQSVMQLTQRGKFKLPTADKKLQVQTSVAGNITVCAYYYSEA